ncbi:TetR family transcriptional regulator C-terminal domain-containing protein [Vibrio hibernica]|uniref:TetR family transcriptional regulator C-terminal domain-containing protein n=1 Tax=Vibrio hibernica TaxID=2587465 RepID=UPI0018821FB7|nr:TetR family transcriptional regulator C-terminal domain-containing protein [Vibrio hibernica]
MAKVRERNQHAIIEAASQHFAKYGYAATKVADIAKEANIPKPNIYYYYTSKDNLYRAVLESVTAPLLKSSLPIQVLDNPKEALTEYIKTKLIISRDHAHASKVFANEVMSGGTSLPKDIEDELQQQSEMILAKFNSWMSQGLMEKVSAHHLMFTIWAATQTYADFGWQICRVLDKKKLSRQDYDEAAEFLTTIILKGCGVKN